MVTVREDCGIFFFLYISLVLLRKVKSQVRRNLWAVQVVLVPKQNIASAPSYSF